MMSADIDWSLPIAVFIAIAYSSFVIFFYRIPRRPLCSCMDAPGGRGVGGGDHARLFLPRFSPGRTHYIPYGMAVLTTTALALGLSPRYTATGARRVPRRGSKSNGLLTGQPSSWPSTSYSQP